MRKYRGSIDRATAAPLVVDRINAVNCKLMNANGEIGVIIHPRCKKLIEDIEQTRWDEKNRKLDHGNPSRGLYRTHWSDAFGYLIHRKWPVTTYGNRILGRGWANR